MLLKLLAAALFIRAISGKQLTDHMKLKRKEDQRTDPSVLLRRGNNIIKGSRGW